MTPSNAPKSTESARDRLRRITLGNVGPDKRLITFMGAEIELRQPLLREVLKRGEDGMGVVEFLISNAYVPDTDENVYEDADKDTLEAIPFGPEVTELTRAINVLTGINVPEGKKD